MVVAGNYQSKKFLDQLDEFYIGTWQGVLSDNKRLVSRLFGIPTEASAPAVLSVIQVAYVFEGDMLVEVSLPTKLTNIYTTRKLPAIQNT